jgi:hypothetical protein
MTAFRIVGSLFAGILCGAMVVALDGPIWAAYIAGVFWAAFSYSSFPRPS